MSNPLESTKPNTKVDHSKQNTKVDRTRQSTIVDRIKQITVVVMVVVTIYSMMLFYMLISIHTDSRLQ